MKQRRQSARRKLIQFPCVQTLGSIFTSQTGSVLIVSIGLLGSGCTHHAARRQAANLRLVEEKRALTTAVVDALQSQPAPNRDIHTATALTFARQSQRVEGLPLQPFDVPALLAGAVLTNGAPVPPNVAAAREEVHERFAKENSLLAAQAREEAKLLDLGVQAESARNERITRWTKFSLGTITFLGGAVALILFCPLALPILGRVLAWIVGKLPGLASTLGVVSVHAFDAVVRAVEKTKAHGNSGESGAGPEPETFPAYPAAPTVPVANMHQTVSPGDSRRGRGAAGTFVDRLHNHLAREMDASHKALVNVRKARMAS